MSKAELYLGEDFEEGKISQAPVLSHIIELDVSERTREIFIGSEIDSEFGPWFTKVMRRLESLSHEPITIWLNTNGGDMEGMFVYYDLVTKSPCPITVVGIGTVCSAGCLMLVCGGTHGGKKLVTESCTFLWHEAKGKEDEPLTESEKRARRAWEDWTGDYWRLLMGKCSKGKTSKFWKDITNKTREHWVLGGQAIVDAGIADAIYSYALLPAPARKLKKDENSES